MAVTERQHGAAWGGLERVQPDRADAGQRPGQRQPVQQGGLHAATHGRAERTQPVRPGTALRGILTQR